MDPQPPSPPTDPAPPVVRGSEGVPVLRPPRPRPRRRWLRRLGGLGVFLAALVGFLRSETASRVLARAVERAVEGLLGEEVTVGRVQIELFPPAVELSGLLLTHPATGDTIASAASLRATLGWIHHHPTIGRLTLTRPLVELHVDADGLREFRELKGGDGAPPSELPWRELAIDDGTFLLHGEGYATRLGGVSLVPSNLGDERANLTIATAALGLGELEQVATDLVFPGVRLGAQSVELPALDVQFPAFGVDGRLAVALDGPLEGDLSVIVRFPELSPPPVDPTHPTPWTDGLLQLDATLGGTTDRPAADGVLALDGLTFWKTSRKGPLEATSFGDVRGPWSLATTDTGHTLTLDHLGMVWGPGVLDISAVVGLDDHTISGVVTAENASLADIFRSCAIAPTPWVDLRGDVETHVTGTWSPLLLEGPFEVDVLDLLVGDGPLDKPHDTILHITRGYVIGDLLIDPDHLVLDASTIRSGPSHGTVLADIGFGDNGPLSIDVDLPALDLSLLAPLGDLELGGMAQVHGVLAGPHSHLEADAEVVARDFVVLGLPIADTLRAHVTSDMARLTLDEIDATLGATHYSGRYTIDFTRDEWMDTALTVDDGRLADLTGIFVDLGGVDGDVTGTLALTGTPYNLGGESRFDLTDVDLYGEHFDRGGAWGRMTDGEFTLDTLQLTRPRTGDPAGPRAILRARGSVKRGWRLNMEVASDGFTLDHLDHLATTEVPVGGDLTLDAVVAGTLFDWEPRGRLAVRHTRYAGEPLGDTTIRFDTVTLADGPALSWGGDVFGGTAQVRGAIGFFGRQRYDIDATLADFPLQFFHPRGADGSPITASVTGTIRLGGELGDSPTPIDIDGDLREMSVAWQDHVLTAPHPWTFGVHERAVRIPQLDLTGTDGTTLWVRQKQVGSLNLALEGGGTVNLDLVRAFAPGVIEARGAAEIAFHVDPSEAGDPIFTGSVDVRDATVRTEWYPDAFDDLTARVEARSDRYTISNVKARVGGGTFLAPASWIEAVDWAPTRYSLHGQLTDTRVKYFDYLPPIEGDAKLSFEGPAEDPLLSGKITVTAMEFRDRVDWESTVVSLREERLTAAAPEESARYFSMDLAVSAPGTVRLRNNVADAEAAAELRIIGDTARPGMTGDIRIAQGGRVYLHDREFEVTRGELRYIDPYTFDPDLDVVLETDIRSQAQDYHVNYRVNGLFSDWRTSATADPTLSQADVNALLLFGVTREELDQYGGRGLGSALVAETGDLLLSQTALSRANPLIDRWSLVSGVSERGSTTVSSDLRFVAEKQIGNFDLTVETSLGQQIGQDWYAAVERRIASRLYATAYAATQQEGRSLPIGAAYGAEFKLRWDLD